MSNDKDTLFYPGWLDDWTRERDAELARLRAENERLKGMLDVAQKFAAKAARDAARFKRERDQFWGVVEGDEG